MNSVKIVEDFWTAVWKSRNPDAIANFVVEDVVITTGGIEIKGRDKFIAWAWDFLSKINDLNFEVLEIFQNEDGTDKGIVRDAALIAASQRVEHYEMAGYGSAREFAKVLGHSDVAALLDETLTEEKNADKKLSMIS